MVNHSNISNDLFEKNGCLTMNAIERYLDDSLEANEKDRVLAHLKSCNLCRDAVEGFTGFDSENIREDISFLENKLLALSIDDSTTKKRVKKGALWTWIPAAAAVVIIFISVFFLLNTYKADIHFEVTEKIQAPAEEKEIMKESLMKGQSDDLEKDLNEKSGKNHHEQPQVIITKKGEQEVKGEMDTYTPKRSSNGIAKMEKIDSKGIISNSKEEGGLVEKTVENNLAGNDMDEYAFFDTLAEHFILEEAAEAEPVYAERKSGKRGKANTSMAPSYAREFEFFTTVENMPEFPGGEIALNKFINETIQYPQDAIENAIEGKVYVSFLINDQGYIENIEVLNGIGYGCDEEAIRVVKSMPRWTPGMHKDKFVNVNYILPVVFKLD